MTDNRTAQNAHHDGLRGLIRANLAAVTFEVVVPMLVFYGLRAVGVGQWWALMAGIAVALPYVLWRIAHTRRLDLTAAFTLSIMVFSIVIGLLTDDPRALVIREGWISALLGLLGAWMLVTVAVGRPALLVLGRTIAVAKTGEAGARVWEDRWNHDSRFRRGIRALSLVWGIGLVADTVLQIVLVYTLPIDLISIVTNVQWWIVLAGLLTFHIHYTRKEHLDA